MGRWGEWGRSLSVEGRIGVVLCGSRTQLGSGESQGFLAAPSISHIERKFALIGISIPISFAREAYRSPTKAVNPKTDRPGLANLVSTCLGTLEDLTLSRSAHHPARIQPLGTSALAPSERPPWRSPRTLSREPEPRRSKTGMVKVADFGSSRSVDTLLVLTVFGGLRSFSGMKGDGSVETWAGLYSAVPGYPLRLNSNYAGCGCKVTWRLGICRALGF